MGHPYNQTQKIEIKTSVLKGLLERIFKKTFFTEGTIQSLKLYILALLKEFIGTMPQIITNYLRRETSLDCTRVNLALKLNTQGMLEGKASTIRLCPLLLTEFRTASLLTTPYSPHNLADTLSQ